jgi:hypothetical protein
LASSEPIAEIQFLNAICEDREPRTGLPMALAMTLPGLAAVESAKKGGDAVSVKYSRVPNRASAFKKKALT